MIYRFLLDLAFWDVRRSTPLFRRRKTLSPGLLYVDDGFNKHSQRRDHALFKTSWQGLEKRMVASLRVLVEAVASS